VQREVDWGRDLLFFEAEGIGSRIDIPLDVVEAGRYEIVARIAQAPDYGDYYALVDGKPTNLDNREAETSEIPSAGSEVFHNYLPEIYVAVDHPLGWLQLDQGRHTLSFVCAARDGRSAGYNLGVNDVILERVNETASQSSPERVSRQPSSGIVYRGRPLSYYREELRHGLATDRAETVRSIGSFREDAVSAVGDLSKALTDSDAGVRSAAAWALSQIGPAGVAAVPDLRAALTDSSLHVRCLAAIALREIGPRAVLAIPGLVEALSDSQPTVRGAAAQALGAMGPAAKTAVEALTNRLAIPDEPSFVVRAVVVALGKIGPAASSALPALEDMVRTHRLAYSTPLAAWSRSQRNGSSLTMCRKNNSHWRLKALSKVSCSGTFCQPS
jgi:HEAT repeat protein